MPITFDEALQRIQNKYGVDRRMAVQTLKRRSDNQDPALANITDFESSMLKEDVESFLPEVGYELAKGAIRPLEPALTHLSNIIRRTTGATGQSEIERVEDKMKDFFNQRNLDEPGPSWPVVGNPIKTLAYTTGMLPLATLVGMPLEAAPYIGGSGLIKEALQRAITFGGIEYATSGDFQKAKGAAIGGAVTPWVLHGLWSLGKAGASAVLDRIFERSFDPNLSLDQGPEGQIPRFDSQIDYKAKDPFGEEEVPGSEAPLTQKEANSRTLQMAQASQMPVTEPAVEANKTLEAARQVFGGPAPAAAGIEASAEDVRNTLFQQKAVEESNAPQYFNAARQGEPFEATRTKLLSTSRGDVYVAPEHPSATGAPTQPVTVQNPQIITLKGDGDYYREAVERTFPDAPGLLELYDSVHNKESLAREILAREAKIRGFDSVILRGNDPSKDLLLDFSKWEKSGHPELDKEMSQLISAERFRGNVVMRRARPELTPEEVERAGKEAFGLKPEPPEGGTWFSRRFKTGSREDILNRLNNWRQRVQTAAPDDLARANGFENVKDFMGAIVKSLRTPFEVYSDAMKPGAPEYRVRAVMGRAIGAVDVAPTLSTAQHQALTEVVNAALGRQPELGSMVGGNVYVTTFTGSPHEGAFAFVRPIVEGGRNKLALIIDSESLPGTPGGNALMARDGYAPEHGREFMVETLEHELHHVGQYMSELQATGGYEGPMWSTVGLTPQLLGRMEVEAEAPALRQRQLYQEHLDLQRRINAIPEEVRERVMDHYIDTVSKPAAARIGKVAAEEFASNEDVAAWKKKALERRYKRKDDDLGVYDEQSRNMAIGAVVAPDKVYSETIKKAKAEADALGPTFGGKWIRPPQDGSRNPYYKWLIARGIEHEDEMFKWSDDRRVSLWNAFKDVKDKDALAEAIKGTEIRPDGSYFQVNSGVPDDIIRRAETVRKDVLDAGWERTMGYKAEVAARIQEAGLQDTEKQLIRLRNIQMGLPVKRITPVEQQLARELEGQLNWDDSHDLRPEYIKGYLTMEPIPNMQAEIKNQINHLEDMQARGFTDQFTTSNMQLLKENYDRLAKIEQAAHERYMRALPSRDSVPRKSFLGYAHVAANEDLGIYQDKDYQRVLMQYLDGISHKHFMDQVMSDFRKVEGLMPGTVRDMAVNWVNALRGIKGMREDSWAVDFANHFNNLNKALGGKGDLVDYGLVRKFYGNIMELNTVAKLTLGPVRFPLIQLTHLTNAWAVAKGGYFEKSFFYTIGNWSKAVGEAMDAGVLPRDSDVLRDVRDYLGGGGHTKFTGTANFLSKWTEYFRKAVSYHTFRFEYLGESGKPGWKPNTDIHTTFIEDVPGRSISDSAKAYGRAGVTSTQFRLTPAARPPIMAGGGLRRVVGQFRTWPVNYASLFGKVMRYGDNVQRSKLAASLLATGGLSTFTLGPSILNMLRQTLLRHGANIGGRPIIIPRDAGYQGAINALGFAGTPLGEIEISTWKEPFDIPRSLQDLPAWALGPTIGSAAQLMAELPQAKTTGQMMKETLSAISPQARAVMDAYLEYQRGGIMSPSGEPLVMGRGLGAAIVRGLDLSPSIKTVRYDYENDIIAALEGGNQEVAVRLMNQARQRGIVFGPRTRQHILSQVKQYYKENRQPLSQQLQ